jgi:hypothetical protein
VVAFSGVEHGADGLVLVGPDHSRVRHGNLEGAGVSLQAGGYTGTPEKIAAFGSSYIVAALRDSVGAAEGCDLYGYG